MTTAHLPPDAARGTRTHRASGAPASRWTRRRLEDVWDRHSRAVYTLACALVGDEAAAAQAVRLGMTDLSRFDDETSVDDAHRSWAHHVYLRTQQLADGASAKHNSVGRLAPVDRACVALCLFGGHTYREVASLLDVPPRTVAELLTASLRDVERLADGGAVANA